MRSCLRVKRYDRPGPALAIRNHFVKRLLINRSGLGQPLGRKPGIALENSRMQGIAHVRWSSVEASTVATLGLLRKTKVGGRSPVVGAPKNIRAGIKESGQSIALTIAAIRATCATAGRLRTWEGAKARRLLFSERREYATSSKTPLTMSRLRTAI